MEFGHEPTVVFARRLGNDTGHVRPLLVCLLTEDVLAIMNNTKTLRHSDSARNMYITEI